jgi:hypothetical protein
LEGIPEELAKVGGTSGIEIVKVADVPSLCKVLFK